MNYRNTPYDFRLQALPISGGAFSSFLRLINGTLDVAGVFEDYIAPALYNTPKVFSSRDFFTLVNVTCTHSGMSFGCLPTPPKDALPLACTWYFTFSLSHETYTTKDKIHRSQLRWINCRVWGPKSNFITIGIPHVESQYLRLKYDMLTPRAVYFMIGCLSKSFVRSHRYWNTTEPKDYSANYKALLPDIMRSSLYMTPLYNLVGRLPYHLWVYNRHTWLSAPGLLSDKHITNETLLYILMYIRVKSMPKKIEDKVLDLLQQNLLDLLRLADQPNNGNNGNTDSCLYTALIYRDDIPDHGAKQWLKQKERSVIEFGLDRVSDYKDYLRDLFYGD